MDADVAKYLDACKDCRWLYTLTGKCEKPGDLECPKDVRQPQQEYAKE